MVTSLDHSRFFRASALVTRNVAYFLSKHPLVDATLKMNIVLIVALLSGSGVEHGAAEVQRANAIVDASGSTETIVAVDAATMTVSKLSMDVTQTTGSVAVTKDTKKESIAAKKGPAVTSGVTDNGNNGKPDFYETLESIPNITAASILKHLPTQKFSIPYVSNSPLH